MSVELLNAAERRTEVPHPSPTKSRVRPLSIGNQSGAERSGVPGVEPGHPTGTPDPLAGQSDVVIVVEAKLHASGCRVRFSVRLVESGTD